MRARRGHWPKTDPVIAALVAAADCPSSPTFRRATSPPGPLGALPAASGPAASAIHGRLVAAMGGEVTPTALLSLAPETLRAVGLSGNKAASLTDLATKVIQGTGGAQPTRLARESDDEVNSPASTVRGIGPWTAQMFLMFQLAGWMSGPPATSVCARATAWPGGCRCPPPDSWNRWGSPTAPTGRSSHGTAGELVRSTPAPSRAPLLLTSVFAPGWPASSGRRDWVQLD